MSVELHLSQAPADSLLKTLLACSCAALLASVAVEAQTTYTCVDLTPVGSFGTANAVSDGAAAGYTARTSAPAGQRAALWTGAGLTDLHPAFLGDPTLSRSVVAGFAGTLQVGWGAGPATTNRAVAVAWRDTAASAVQLTPPFTSFGAQATATDGVQIVGWATGLNRDGTAVGTSHAVVWDVATGVGVDLGEGGLGALAMGVGGGLQAGYTYRSSGAVATIWRGTARSQVVIHPKSAVVSLLSATDGVRQVGFAGFDFKRPGETNKGGTTFRYNYASVWSGTAASWINIHPFGFAQSYALAVNGTQIAGYALNTIGTGNPASHHAIVWDAALQPTDLNAFLPTGFTGAMATGVDAGGTVSGSIFTADGQRHAAVWIPNP